MLVSVKNGTLGYSDGAIVTVKHRGDPPFELDEKEARRLIDMGAVEPAVEWHSLPDIEPSDDRSEPVPGEAPALEEMTVAQLKTMALDLGLDVSDCRRKQDLIDRIAGEDGVEDGEEPPELGAEAPVL